MKQRIIGISALTIIALIAIAILSDRGHAPTETGLAAGVPSPQPLKLNLPAQQPAPTNAMPTNAVAQATAAAQAPVSAVTPVQKSVESQNIEPVAPKPVPAPVVNAPKSVPAVSATKSVSQTTTAAKPKSIVATQTKTKPQAKSAATATTHPAKKTTTRASYANKHKKLAPAKVPDAWTIKLGVFSKQANAEKLVKELRVKGYRAYMHKEKTGKQTFYRVFVGPELKRAKAQQAVAKIQKSFRLKGEIVKYKV